MLIFAVCVRRCALCLHDFAVLTGDLQDVFSLFAEGKHISKTELEAEQHSFALVHAVAIVFALYTFAFESLLIPLKECRCPRDGSLLTNCTIRRDFSKLSHHYIPIGLCKNP